MFCAQQSLIWLVILIPDIRWWNELQITKTTSKGKQDLINAEATCITKVLDDGTDTGLLEVLNQSQQAEATSITKVLDDGTDTGLLEVLNQSQLKTKQQRGVYAMMSQLMAQQFSFINKENYYNNKTTKRRLRYDEPVNGTTILFYW